ncbi:MAG TPA: hypothetical protein VMS87_06750, partial [Roseiarcus sp.]|nr:hypothetical protein [Roseiarcus sp.]
KAPDHSWLSRTRSRPPHEAHATAFGWVLKLVAERGLVKGERIGVDGPTPRCARSRGATAARATARC